MPSGAGLPLSLRFAFFGVGFLMRQTPPVKGLTWLPASPSASCVNIPFPAKLSSESPEFHWASPRRIPVASWYPPLKSGIDGTPPAPLEQNENRLGGF